MTDVVTRARTLLEAWREQGADRIDVVRFHYIEALAQRARAQTGTVRLLLDDKLSSLLDTYARDVASRQSGNTAITEAYERSPLGELVDQLARHAAARGHRETPAIEAVEARQLPPLDALDEFQQIWSQVRTQSQVRQSMEQAPTNAGPLNSSALVHRSIALMRDLSPGYLQQFLAYIDDLAWLEQLVASSAPAIKETPAPAAKKRSRRKAKES
ncbi:DUF2894 domain-containing protein [Dyella jiangningensis]|uniref:DUF2894 domain-containing protein n=1 Tax=Dyella jiangningensis TaxID=1379159 RepID=UPI00240EE6DE|nr:DUF2894 domain-containing protein [Dyella jiangningensis]MDG2538668.1 DUF2894 domain-containing protein [Dyella jiangningensis]